MKDYQMIFVLDGKEVGSASVIVDNGQVNTANVEDEFYAVLRKNEKSLIKNAEMDEYSDIVDNLTTSQEDLLKEEHAKEYAGTDDDMPDAFEGWLEDLSLDEIKRILK